MPNRGPHLTRRGVLLAGAASLPSGLLFAATEPLVTVHKDPNCGCWKYEVVLFGPSGRRSYMRFLGSSAVD